MRRPFRIFRHVVGFLILAAFVASFFVGVKYDPGFVDIARSPYGLFTYFILTAFTFFVPSMITVPIVTTATIIWGPWIAGSVAIIGWTLGKLVEYYAAIFALGTIKRFVNGSGIEEKLARVRSSINFWQLSIARMFIPAFIFGLARTPIKEYIASSIVAYIPLALLGVGSGALLRPYLDKIQPLLIGAALIVLIFTLDYFLLHRREQKPPQNPNAGSDAP